MTNEKELLNELRTAEKAVKKARLKIIKAALPNGPTGRAKPGLHSRNRRNFAIRLRELGFTWKEIGDALGVTLQAARGLAVGKPRHSKRLQEEANEQGA